MLLATSAGMVFLLLATPNLGPALRAARADGVAGAFVAKDLRCAQHPGHEQCSWWGTFRPDGGGRERTGVHLYGSGRGTLVSGQRVAAVDTGRSSRVYPPVGSREWIPTFGLAIAGFLLFVPLGREALRVARSFRSPDEHDEVAPRTKAANSTSEDRTGSG